MKKPDSSASVMADVVQLRRERLGIASDMYESSSGQAKGDLVIKEVKGWTLLEPVSQRTYTVIKIQTDSGLTGYGECAQLSQAEFAEAKKIITGVPVTSFEIIAPKLAMYPNPHPQV